MRFRWKDLLDPKILALLAAGWFIGPLAAFLLWFHYSTTTLLVMIGIGLFYVLLFLWLLTRVHRR